MTNQTAVEWLAEKIYNEGLDDEFVKQAKAMEKEQIIEAFTKGELVKDNYFDYANPFNIKGQNYYNETYNK